MDLCASSTQQVNTDAMRVDERKIFATTKEDLDLDENPIIENTQISYLLHANTNVLDPVAWQHQALTIQAEQKTLEVPQSRRLRRVVDMPVVGQQRQVSVPQVTTEEVVRPDAAGSCSRPGEKPHPVPG